MGVTLDTVIDRLYRDYLTPPDEQPAQAPLAVSIDSDDTSFQYKAANFTVEEEDSIGPGTLVEIDQELMRVTSMDEDGRTIGVTRGVLGTTAAAHTAPALVVIRPKYPRQTVFDAVADAFEDLGGDLFAIVVSDTFSTTASLMEVPAAVQEVVGVYYKTSQITSSTYTRYVQGAWELLTNMPTTVSSTGKALQLFGITESRTAYYQYKTYFTRPTDETYDLTDDAPNFQTKWIPLVHMNALINLLAGADITARTVEYITEALEAQGFPTGSGESLDQYLVRIFEYRLSRAMKDLNRNWPMKVKQSEVVWG